MPSLTLENSLIWFAHCPKAGGTSVERMLIDHFGADSVSHLHWGWDLWWKRGGWRKADPPNSPQHLTWEDAVKKLPRLPDQVFALVRDPVDRMTSEKKWQRCIRRGTWAGKLLAALPFSLWLRIVLAMAKRDAHVFDNHLRPQTDFVPQFARVFHLEHGMGAVADWLAQFTEGVNFGSPPHLLSTKGSCQLRPEDAALIAFSFASDYEVFQYEKPNEHKRHRPVFDTIAWVVAPFLIWFERRALI